MAIRQMKKLIGKAVDGLRTDGLRVTLVRAKRKILFAPKKLRKLAFDSISQEELEAQRNTAFSASIKFSILVPLYNTPIAFLDEMITSVQNQTYANWELCLADGSDDEHRKVGDFVIRRRESDPRILYRKLSKNLGISGNTNACIEMATGDYISLFDHDDVLHPAALFETMKVICDEHADFIYTDEVTFSSPDLNALYSVHLKPDFAPDNLLANNYICHFTSFSRSLLERSGAFDPEFDGSQDHDMILRLTQNAQRIVHIPKVLYFWRSHEKSVAMDIGAKSYAIEAGQKAVAAAAARMGYSAKVESTPAFPAIYRLKYDISAFGKVSVIIPADKTCPFLGRCVERILSSTTYPDFEVFLVGTWDEHRNDPRLRIIDSRHNNPVAALRQGAGQATGEYLTFLAPDALITSPDWLEQLVMYAQRNDVGAVGAMATLPNHRLLHTGYILGLGQDGLPGESFVGFPVDYAGYMGSLAYAQNVSAVSGQCLMVQKKQYDSLGGFDHRFHSSLYDIDFCLRLREQGFLNVWTPFAQLQVNDDQALTEQDKLLWKQRWSKQARDPYYNPNFSFEAEGYRINPGK